jgi:RNA polymerase sigma-70 factor (ECF subfamily)
MELNPDERRLVQDCLKRERHAQKELYDRYKDAMYTIAFRISSNSDDASDVLQDAFVQVFRDLHQYSGQSTLGAWIKTIVIRTALRNVKMAPVTESMEVVTGREVIEWPEAMNGEYLHQAIESLPPGYKVVFLLTEVEGYSHKEVSEMMQISVGTSKSQLSRAKKLLQQKLKLLIQ